MCTPHRRSLRALLVLSTVLVAGIGLAHGSEPGAAPAPTQAPAPATTQVPAQTPTQAPAAARAPVAEKVALAISGGVSLGGYESGAVWTWLKYMRARNAGAVPDATDVLRPTELVGLTGASAGGINALLSSVMWCATDEAFGSVDTNLVRGAWSAVGFDALLPLSGSDDFYALDGLLTRRAFEPALGPVQDMLDQPVFIPGCRVPMAMTVTRGKAWVDHINGLATTNQRFAVPLALVVDAEGYAWFVNDTGTTRNEEQLGNFILLAERRGEDEKRMRGRAGGLPPPWVVPASVALQAMLASSAFPLAFSPVVLPQCIPTSKCPDDGPAASLRDIEWLSCGDREGCGDFTSLTCEALTTRDKPVEVCASRFVDGGFFDNVPLGVSMAQAEATEQPGLNRVDYIYFDPDVRRLKAETDPVVTDEGDRGLDRVLAILGQAVTTGRSYELYSTLRYETFGLSSHGVVERVGNGLAEMASVLNADNPPSGPPLGGSVGACLDAVMADQTDGCQPLPTACVALMEATAVVEGEAAARPPIPLIDPVSRAAACLPRDAQKVENALDRLSALMRCRSLESDFGPDDQARHRRLAAGVVGSVATVRTCLGFVPATENGRMAVARFDADLRTATRYLQSVEAAEHERRLRLPSRFAPLSAGQLRNFGAFFDGPLRSYDYWVGVHDGLVNLAEKRCFDQWAAEARRPSAEQHILCVVERLGRLRSTLLPDASAIGNHLLTELQIQEMVVRARSATPPLPGPCGDDGRLCPDAPPCDFADPVDVDVCLAHKALTSCEGDEKRVFKRGTGTFCPGDFGMSGFIDALESVGYTPRSEYMRRLLTDPQWWTTPARIGLARAEELEASEATRARRRSVQPVAGDTPGMAKARVAAARAQAESAATKATLFSAGSFVLGAVLQEYPMFTMVPTSIPESVGFHPAMLLPYRIGVDPLHGGAVLGWEPRIGAGRVVEGRFLLEGIRWRDDKAGLRSSVATMLAIRPWSSTLLGAWGVGPVVERTWGKGGWDVGARTHLDLGLDALRLSFGALFYRVSDPEVTSKVPPVKFTLELSLLDLPGLAWLITR